MCIAAQYYLLWFLSVSVASRLGSITVHSAYGGRELEEKEEWGSPLPSWLKQQDSPLKPNDTRLTPKSQLTSPLILSCFKTPHSQLLRNGASLDASYSSHIFFSAAPLFFPEMAFTHKSIALHPAQEVGWNLCTVQPLMVCWLDDKGRERQSHQGSPRPCLVLLSCW